METTLNLTTLKGGVYSQSFRSRVPSGSDPMSPRQTAALLPTDFTPTGRDAAKQEVTDQKQEQSRLVEETRQMAEKANAYMRLADTHLEFKVNEQTGRIVISVIDSDTKEVVRQIPPETLDRFANRITQMRGLLFETTG